MTRWLFGQSPADFTVDAGGRPRPGVRLTVWTEASGGELVTDLLTWDGLPVDAVTSDASGLVRFYGPDGYLGVLWLDSGSGVRLACKMARLPEWVGSSTSPDGVVTVTDYGAAGDGITDDSAAIAAAIDAAGVGGTIYFPPAAAGYAVSEPITPLRQQRIIGAYQTKFEADPAPGTAPGAVRARSDFTGPGLVRIPPGSYGVHIERMALIGPGAGHPSGCAGIAFPDRGDYIGEIGASIRDCLINNMPGPGFGGHMWVLDVDQCMVSQCSWGLDASGGNALLDARIRNTQFSFNRDGGTRLAGTARSGAFTFHACRWERSGGTYGNPASPANPDAPGIHITNAAHGHFHGETDANTGRGLHVDNPTGFVYNLSFDVNFVRDGGGAQTLGYGWLWTEADGWHEVPLGTAGASTITGEDIPGVEIGRAFHIDLSRSRVSYGASDDSGTPVPIPGGGGATCPPPISPAVGVRAHYSEARGLRLANRIEVLPEANSLDIGTAGYVPDFHLPALGVHTVPVVESSAYYPTAVDVPGLVVYDAAINSLVVRTYSGAWRRLIGWDGTNPMRLSPIVDLYGAAGADQAVRFYQDGKIRALLAADDVTGDVHVDVYDTTTEAYLGSPLVVRNATRTVDLAQIAITPDGAGRVLAYFNAPAGQTGTLVEYRVGGTLTGGVTAGGRAFGPAAAGADHYIPLGQLKSLVAASATWGDFQTAIAAL